MQDSFSSTVSDWLIDPGLSIIAIILFAWAGRHFGGLVITQIVRRLVRSTHFNPLSPEDVTKRRDTLSSLFTVIWKVILVVVASCLIFQQLFPKVDLGPLFASAGLIGVAIGFGAQSLIKDFLSGVFIIVENQYRVGDIVDIQGAAGTVERVTIRSTVIRDASGNVHFLPNGEVLHVINKTMGFSKVNFTLTVDPDTDIDKLSNIIDEVGLKLSEDEKWKEKILEAPHFLNIGTFSDLALEVTITGKTNPSQQWSVTGEMRRRLLKAFAKHKIELAHVPGLPISDKK
jgi:small conductance mechanosensitive channel